MRRGIPTPSTRKVVLLTASLYLHLSHVYATTTTCYFPSGDPTPSDVPCSNDSGDSTCCAPGYVCLSNGVCMNPSPGATDVYFRASCTDRTWKSSTCPGFCNDVQEPAHDNQWGLQRMGKCPNDGVDLYFCNDDNVSAVNCAATQNVILFLAAVSPLTTIGVTGLPVITASILPTPTSVSTSSSIPTSTSSSSSSSPTPSSTSKTTSSTTSKTTSSTTSKATSSTQSTSSSRSTTSSSSTSHPTTTAATTPSPTSKPSSASSAATISSTSSQVNTTSTPNTQTYASQHAVAIGAGVGASAGAVILILAALAFLYKRRKDRDLEEVWNGEPIPPRRPKRRDAVGPDRSDRYDNSEIGEYPGPGRRDTQEQPLLPRINASPMNNGDWL